MKDIGVGTASQDIETLFGAGSLAGLSDGQLLDRFVARREEFVFEAIIRRHGPMVWGVCRRILRDHHDAEDAFQATFLVLARKAASIGQGEKVGNWLHGVAYRTSMKARATRADRRVREIQPADGAEPERFPDDPQDGLLSRLDLEMGRLPDRYRIPIILCELQGRSHREAAEQLGWPIGTVSGRLSRARSILASRMSRADVTLSVGSLAAMLAGSSASASMPTHGLGSMAKLAGVFATRRAASPELVSIGAIRLAEGVIRAMNLGSLKSASAIVAAIGLLGAWTALAAYPPKPEGSPRKAETPAPQLAPAPDLRPIPAVEEAGPVLRGRVTDEAGRPLAGAKIALYSGQGTLKRGQDAVTGEDGTYRFSPLTTGNRTEHDPIVFNPLGNQGGLGVREPPKGWDRIVAIQLIHPTHACRDGESWRFVKVPDVDGHEEVRNFEMIPGGRLEGRLLDSRTGRALAGVELRIQSPSFRNVRLSHYATTDRRGRFALRALFPAEYVIDVNLPRLGYPVLGKAKVEAGKTVDVELVSGESSLVPPRGKDLSGTWRGERDGARVEIEFKGEGRATWTVATSKSREVSATVRADLSLVDDEEAGSVLLRFDLLRPLPDGRTSLLMGRLRRGRVGILELTMEPEAREQSDVYHVLVKEFPLNPEGPVRVGEVAPPVVSLTIGGDFDVRGFCRGRYTLLTFWSLKDEAGLRQFEALRKIRPGLAEEDRLVIVDVCTDDAEGDHDAWRRFLVGQGKVSYGDRNRPGPFRFYEDHKWLNTIQGGSDFVSKQAYGVERLPEAFLIDPDWRLRAVRIPVDRLEGVVAETLKAAR